MGVAARVIPSAPASELGRLRSPIKRAKRLRSRELVRDAMVSERALVLDFADAVGVDERTARRALAIDEKAAPIDLGDVLAMAETGPGGARLALRVVAVFQAEVCRIAALHR